ncbi:MAG: hypothetical protein CL920_13140 [Deltaproteobacteria bacterium]|nr:hypothetical protein [Deltaproteobacteria bacterium]MBU49634.1 hypothetical protein [Deltaproteobacteria bacterium]
MLSILKSEWCEKCGQVKSIARLSKPTPKGFNQGGRQAKRARGTLFPPLVRLQKVFTNKKLAQNPLNKTMTFFM